MATYDVLTSWRFGYDGASAFLVDASGYLYNTGDLPGYYRPTTSTYTKITIPGDRTVASVASGGILSGGTYYSGTSGVVTTDGKVYLFGNILSSNEYYTGTLYPTPIEFTLANGKIGKRIYISTYIVIVLCTDGTIQGLGVNNKNQQGDGTTTYISSFKQIAIQGNKQVKHIALNQSFVLAVCTDGTIQGWGTNDGINIGGQNSTTPVSIPVNKTIVSASAVQYGIILLCDDGTLLAAGYSFPDNTVIPFSSGRLYETFEPITLSGGKTAKFIASGSRHTAVICSDNTIQMWGVNSAGQLGIGSTSNSAPTTVSLLNGKTPLALALGGQFTVCICTDGSVQAWGSNSRGAIGTGENISQYTSPVNINFTANTMREILSYIVTYVNNGGTGDVSGSPFTVTSGGSHSIQGQGTVARSGYTFDGWNTNASGTGTNYTAGSGSIANITQNITLYAKWTATGDGGGAVCFLGNAPVLTPSGYRRIDSLAVGDLVRTADGRDVAIQRVKHQRVVAPSATVNPFVIPKGQWGAMENLAISPRHAVAVPGRGMVEARDLGLRQMNLKTVFDYYNLELPEWDNMIVAGVEVESLAPTKKVVLTVAQFRALLAGKDSVDITKLSQIARVREDGLVDLVLTRKARRRN